MVATQVDHIELVVNDLDGFIQLFDAMGFQELSRTTHHGLSVEFQLPGPNQPIFEMHQADDEEVIGVNHIAFRVDDVKAAGEELRAKGARLGEPHYVAATGRLIVNGRDPDGWRIQFVDTRRRTPAG
jgi:glyoxylase I family protein